VPNQEESEIKICPSKINALREIRLGIPSSDMRIGIVVSGNAILEPVFPSGGTPVSGEVYASETARGSGSCHSGAAGVDWFA
jgi:hypothetical protein